MPTRFNRAAAAELPMLFDDLLLNAVQDTGDFEVIGAADIRAMLDLLTQQEAVGCEPSWCWTDIVGAMGAHAELSFRVVRLPEDRWIAVGKLMDIRRRRITRLRSTLLVGNAQQVMRRLPHMVREILAPHGQPSIPSPPPITAQKRRRRGDMTPCAGDPRACKAQCLEGHATSCEALASMYFTGRGVRRAWGEAGWLYERACALGATSACNNLGVLYALGYGVDEDARRARSLFELACDRGDDTACHHLAQLVFAREGQVAGEQASPPSLH